MHLQSQLQALATPARNLDRAARDAHAALEAAAHDATVLRSASLDAFRLAEKVAQRVRRVDARSQRAQQALSAVQAESGRLLLLEGVRRALSHHDLATAAALFAESSGSSTDDDPELANVAADLTRRIHARMMECTSSSATTTTKNVDHRGLFEALTWVSPALGRAAQETAWGLVATYLCELVLQRAWDDLAHRAEVVASSRGGGGGGLREAGEPPAAWSTCLTELFRDIGVAIEQNIGALRSSGALVTVTRALWREVVETVGVEILRGWKKEEEEAFMGGARSTSTSTSTSSLSTTNDKKKKQLETAMASALQLCVLSDEFVRYMDGYDALFNGHDITKTSTLTSTINATTATTTTTTTATAPASTTTSTASPSSQFLDELLTILHQYVSLEETYTDTMLDEILNHTKDKKEPSETIDECFYLLHQSCQRALSVAHVGVDVGVQPPDAKAGSTTLMISPAHLILTHVTSLVSTRLRPLLSSSAKDMALAGRNMESLQSQLVAIARRVLPPTHAEKLEHLVWADMAKVARDLQLAADEMLQTQTREILAQWLPKTAWARPPPVPSAEDLAANASTNKPSAWMSQGVADLQTLLQSLGGRGDMTNVRTTTEPPSPQQEQQYALLAELLSNHVLTDLWTQRTYTLLEAYQLDVDVRYLLSTLKNSAYSGFNPRRLASFTSILACETRREAEEVFGGRGGGGGGGGEEAIAGLSMAAILNLRSDLD